MAQVTKIIIFNAAHKKHKNVETLIRLLFYIGLAFLIVANFNTARANNSLTELKRFIDEVSTFRADFTQTVYDANSVVVQTMTGNVTYSKPSLFRFKYEEPEYLEIISDGVNLWTYEKDMEQVIVRRIEDHKKGTPLALLLNANNLYDEFLIVDAGSEDDIIWAELTPIHSENEILDISKMYIGFEKSQLTAMVFIDEFDQEVQILFSSYVEQLPINKSIFNFTPPQGVDVLNW